MFYLKDVNYKNITRFADISICESCATFILGESGVGKTTLLKLLSGIISPTDGEIIYLGKSIEEYNPIKLRREVMLVGQSTYLFDLSIEENFNTYCAYRELAPISKALMQEYLNICAINLPLNSECIVMSGGEKHRVYIAINLSMQSKVIMIDEPTSALDDKNSGILMNNVKEYCKQKGITLIVVSHDKNLADKFADKIIYL